MAKTDLRPSGMQMHKPRRHFLPVGEYTLLRAFLAWYLWVWGCWKSHNPFVLNYHDCTCRVLTDNFQVKMIIQKDAVVDRIMDPKDVHILSLKTYEYITLHGKRNFADVTKLRTLRLAIILDFLGGTNVIRRVLIKGRWEDRSFGIKMAPYYLLTPSSHCLCHFSHSVFGGVFCASNVSSTFISGPLHMLFPLFWSLLPDILVLLSLTSRRSLLSSKDTLFKIAHSIVPLHLCSVCLHPLHCLSLQNYYYW